jgi:serine/threonine-protein kinase
LKRVLPAFSGDPEFVARFRREAVLAAQLRHTNIVGVIDVGEIDSVQYMTLELVDGLDLRSLLNASPGEKLSPDTVALIGLDLAYALEHAHGSLVHRDISPSNILVSRSGEAKLADFGIAKALDDAKATASRSARGKVPYMSPEHMRGESVDGRTDLFSLGVVLFEAMAGMRPFDGAHDVETMQKILEGDRVSLEEVAPDAPTELREIIERLIEVDPAVRTPSAARLIEELGSVSPPPSIRWQLASTVEKHRGGPKARMHVRARDEERDTELSRPPGERENAPPSRRKPRKTERAIILLASALVLSIVAVATGARWLEPQAPVPASALVPASAPLPAPVPAPAPVLVPAGAKEPPTPLRKGWLHVFVQPWGNVWIDGAFMGRAPVKARLSKGRHVVKVGRELPSQTKVVRVEAGARKELEIKLPE